MRSSYIEPHCSDVIWYVINIIWFLLGTLGKEIFSVSPLSRIWIKWICNQVSKYIIKCCLFTFLLFCIFFLRETEQLTVWPMVWLIQWGLMLIVDWWFYNKWINWALFSNLFSNVDLQEKECCISKGKKNYKKMHACIFTILPLILLFFGWYLFYQMFFS